MNRVRAVSLLFMLLGLGLAVALWLYGADFYTTHPWDRTMHADYEELRSAGGYGHGVGLAGTALILLNLTFMLRRRISSWRRFGALRLWMNMHVVTGLVGPLLVVFHTAFYPRTTVAIVAFASLGVLVVTGLIGRFIYAMIPHTLAGAEMGPEELEARLDEAHAQLARAASPEDPVWPTLDRLAQASLVTPRTTLGLLLALPLTGLSNLALRLRLYRLSRVRTDLSWSDLRDIVLLRRRLHALTLYRRLLRWWRALHRAFALVMIVTMTIHVAVLLYLGYVPGVGS